MSANMTVANTRSGSVVLYWCWSSGTPRTRSSTASVSRWSKAGGRVRAVPHRPRSGICAARARPPPTSMKVSSGRWMMRVGVRIEGRMSRMSIPLFIRMSVSAAEGAGRQPLVALPPGSIAGVLCEIRRKSVQDPATAPGLVDVVLDRPVALRRRHPEGELGKGAVEDQGAGSRSGRSRRTSPPSAHPRRCRGSQPASRSRPHPSPHGCRPSAPPGSGC